MFFSRYLLLQIVMEEGEGSSVTVPSCVPMLDSDSTGERRRPAHSCQHICHLNSNTAGGIGNISSLNSRCRVHYTAGLYWIDPNLGCSSDAVQVYCNCTSRKTCVIPNTTVTQVPPYIPPLLFMACQCQTCIISVTDMCVCM